VVETGTPLDLYLHPKRLFTANFLGETNFLTGKIVKFTKKRSAIDVNGNLLQSNTVLDSDAKEVVVAVRPDYVIMTKAEKKGSWKGVVENRIFIGSLIRYEVRLKSGELVVAKHPVKIDHGFNAGDKVNLTFPAQRVLLYPFPQAGLETEISIRP